MIEYRRKNAGLTITELLAVVTILIVLILIVTSGLRSSYKKMESIQCSNNLRKIGIAVQLYSSDYDLLLPTPGRTSGETWRRKLVTGEYISTQQLHIYSCPSLPAPCNYRINAGFYDGSFWEHGDEGEGGPKDISSISNPATTILISEYQNLAMTTGIDSAGNETITDHTMWSGNYPSQPNDALQSIHNGGCNYLFVDFHVEWIDKEDMQNDPHNYTVYEKP